MSEAPTVEQALESRFARPPVAFSADGISFYYTAPLDGGIPLGSFVRIAHDGNVLLGQVLSQEIATEEGPELDIETTAPVEVRAGMVTGGRYRAKVRQLAGSGKLLGRLEGGAVAPLGRLGGFGERPLSEASVADVTAFMRGELGSRAALHVGQVEIGGESAPAMLRADGFARHSFLCGQSGSGKTYSLGVVLERLVVETDLRIVILDPNSDHVGLGQARDEADGAERYRERAGGVRVASGDSLRLRFSDLDLEGQALVLGMHPLADRHEYRALFHTVERLSRDTYSLGDLVGELGDAPEEIELRLRIENLGVERWGIWCEPGQDSVAEQFAADDWRVFVADLGSLATPEERWMLAGGALTRLWRGRELRRPTLIVIDEAHNVCPDLPNDGTQRRATDLAVLIAGEGRKYGLYLLVATQRPQKVHPNVVSQCENLILMRLNSTLDLEHLQDVFSHVPSALLGRAPTFRQGDALVAGRIAVAPMAVRIGGRISPEGGGDVPADWAAGAPSA